MSENLSIDEIIKQAEEIRKKTEKRANSAMKDINADAEKITGRTIEIPKVKPEDIEIKAKSDTQTVSQKTAHFDRKNIVSTADDGKTRVIDQKTRPVKLNNASEKTGVINNVSEIKSKKSFFGQTPWEPLYSKQPPEIVERPATIKSKTRVDHTSDLDELPTIVAVDELDNTKIIGSAHIPKFDNQLESDEDDQIVLEGFEDMHEEVAKIDEDVAEQQLKERRKEKISKFRLFAPDDVDEKKPSVKGEFESADDKTAFLEKLFASKSSATFTSVITFILLVLIGGLTYFKDSAYMPSFLLDYTAYFIALAAIFAIAILVNVKTIIHGFNFKNGVNSDFPVTVLNIIVLVQTILMLFDSNIYTNGGNIYPFAAVFSLLMSGLGKRMMTARIIENFEFMSSLDERNTVEDIVNTVDATIISRGLLSGEPRLKTSIKTDFPTKFLDIACSDEPADKIAKTTGVIMMVLDLLLFGVFSFINKDWQYGFNIAVCAMCISTPCISLLCTNSSLLGVSRTIKKNGAMINGFEGAQMVDNANAIVIEAQDLFSNVSCEIHGKKTFNGAKDEDVILKTGAVIMKTKSPLAYAFDKYIVGKEHILPEVDGVVYEDRLGTSAWIYRKKILVGTRELLIHHGVQVPTENYEAKFTRKGRKVLYLAVTGKLMAMFVVSYSADSNLKKTLKKLEKSGMTVLVKSSDPFINDESIAQLFSLPDGFVRVMNTSNARVFEKYSDMRAEKSPAYVVHNGSALGFVSAMSGAENLEETRKILSVLISFGSAIGLGVVTLLGFIGGVTQLTALNIVIFQAIWCAFVELISKFKRLGL